MTIDRHLFRLIAFITTDILHTHSFHSFGDLSRAFNFPLHQLSGRLAYTTEKKFLYIPVFFLNKLFKLQVSNTYWLISTNRTIIQSLKTILANDMPIATLKNWYALNSLKAHWTFQKSFQILLPVFRFHRRHVLPYKISKKLNELKYFEN